MPTAAPFEAHADRYDRWFDEHQAAYAAELQALEALLETPGDGLEIGVGSGRFAAPLGIDVGLDPAPAMLRQARVRGVAGVRGVAEYLPFRDESFDTALIVTTICFVDDVARTLAEAARVLRPSGRLLIGYVDRESPLGQAYREAGTTNAFYREAVFVATDDLVAALEAAGFGDVAFRQTVFRPPAAVDDTEPVKPGYGEGSFVALRAAR